MTSLPGARSCWVSGRLRWGWAMTSPFRSGRRRFGLSESPAGAENCFEAVVTTSTYIGSDTHIYLDVRGQRIKVWEQNRTSGLTRRAYYRAGQKVWITLVPENTLVLSNA